MRKEIYIVRGTGKESYIDFKNRILQLAEQVAEKESPKAIRLTVTPAPPPKLSIIPFKRSKISTISLYKEDDKPSGLLLKSEGISGAFWVEEAIPVGYTISWPNGEPAPGACLLTMFHKKPGIDYPTFLDRWHNGHTPLSLKLHPLWNYNRNVVREKISGHEAWYDGIVEETTRTRSELLNPFKFFGRPHKMVQNMLAVYTDTNSFLDYKKIETYLVEEFFWG
jgi:hypothetical protein